MHKRNITDIVSEMESKIAHTNTILSNRRNIRRKTYKFLRNVVLLGAVSYGAFFGITKYIENKSSVDRYVIKAYNSIIEYVKDF